MASNPYVNKVVFGSATLVDLTGTTATADKILQGYGAFGADGAWMDGTASGDNDFVVTLTYNDTTEMWEPNCTFAEAYAAVQAGKNVVAEAGDYNGASIVYDAEEFGGFLYIVYAPFDEYNGSYYYNWGVRCHGYIWTADGIEINEDSVIYNTQQATASPSDVAQGKYFYNANGIQVGTASGQSLVITDTIDSHGGTIREITGKVVHLQTKTITPTSSAQVVDPDTGYDGFSQVTVNAGSSATIQSLTVTPSTSQQVFNSSSVDGYKPVTVNAMPNGSVTSPSSISGTSASVSTGTNTLTLSKTISVTPNVTTAGYISSGTAGNSSVSLTASVTTKAAATITPGTTNQTIASGTYLTGTQTIAGDADLVASNIVSGVQIFGVTGNVVLQNYYTGSSAPSSSLGSNGDLYLQS